MSDEVQGGPHPRRRPPNIVLVMLVYSVVASGGVLTVGNAATSSLFLARLPASAMPYLFLFPGLASALILLAYSGLAARLNFQRLAVASSLLLALVLLAFRALLETSARDSFPVLAALFLVGDTAYTLVLLQFWASAAQVFDARSGKRLFGLVALGGTVAQLLAGLTIGPIAAAVGVPNLLLIVSASLAVAAACANALSRTQPDANRGSAPSEARSTLTKDLTGLLASPLLRAVLALTVLQSLVINLAGYQFYSGLQARFAGDDRGLVAFQGTFTVLTGLAAIAVSAWLTPRVLARGGASAAVSVFPLAGLLTAVAAISSGGALWSVALARGADPVFRRSINEAGMSALLLPVGAGLRARAKTLLGVAYALTVSALGLVFLVLPASGPGDLRWPLAVIATSVMWLGLLRTTRRRYVRAIGDSLRRRALDGDDVRSVLTDPTALGALASGLATADEAHAVQILDLLRHGKSPQCDAVAMPLLANQSPQVRVLALRFLARPGNKGAADACLPLFQAPEEEVREAAVEAYFTISGESDEGRLAAALENSDARLRGAALRGLLQGVGHVSAGAAGVLSSLASSRNSSERREAARALAVAASGSETLLETLLADTDLSVRREAIRACRGPLHLPLAPTLIAQLSVAGCEEEAADALVRLGPGVESPLAEAWTEGHPKAWRIASILGKVGTPAAAGALLQHLSEADEAARSATCEALARLPLPAGSHSTIEAALEAEVRAAYDFLVARADLAVQAGPFLEEALDLRARACLARSLCLLQAIHPGEDLERAARALRFDEPGSRALAVELVDSVARPSERRLLVPALEAGPTTTLHIATERLGLTRQSPATRLLALASGRDPWLRACAVERLADVGALESASVIATALDDADDLVRETALAAVRRKMDDGSLPGILARHARDDAFPSTARYARAHLAAGGAL